MLAWDSEWEKEKERERDQQNKQMNFYFKFSSAILSGEHFSFSFRFLLLNESSIANTQKTSLFLCAKMHFGICTESIV